VTEPRPLVTFDQSTQTFWVVKPDKIKLMHAKFKGSQYQFLGVDDIKSGRARHRLAEALSFMMGKVIRDANAAKLLWGVDFDGPVKTRLIYLKNERGRRLSEPSSKVDTIGAQLSDKQKAWLWGIERYIKEMDEVWKRGLFRLQPGSHCNTCEFRNDCKVGQQFLADVAATTAGGAPDDQQPEDKGC
jgi:hypothetical protein